MKRSKPLIPLSMEHHQALVIAKRCKRVLQHDDAAAKAEMAATVIREFPYQLEKHFVVEEQTLFKTARRYPEQMLNLVQQLEAEHAQLRDLYRQIEAGEWDRLGEFGELLAQHARKEERELFELAQQLFTEQELDEVYQASL